MKIRSNSDDGKNDINSNILELSSNTLHDEKLERYMYTYLLRVGIPFAAAGSNDSVVFAVSLWPVLTGVTEMSGVYVDR